MHIAHQPSKSSCRSLAKCANCKHCCSKIECTIEAEWQEPFLRRWLLLRGRPRLLRRLAGAVLHVPHLALQHQGVIHQPPGRGVEQLCVWGGQQSVGSRQVHWQANTQGTGRIPVREMKLRHPHSDAPRLCSIAIGSWMALARVSHLPCVPCSASVCHVCVATSQTHTPGCELRCDCMPLQRPCCSHRPAADSQQHAPQDAGAVSSVAPRAQRLEIEWKCCPAAWRWHQSPSKQRM